MRQYTRWCRHSTQRGVTDKLCRLSGSLSMPAAAAAGSKQQRRRGAGSRQLTVGAEHGGGEGAAGAQQLPAHRTPDGAQILSQQCHKVACAQVAGDRQTGNRAARADELQGREKVWLPALCAMWRQGAEAQEPSSSPLCGPEANHAGRRLYSGWPAQNQEARCPCTASKTGTSGAGCGSRPAGGSRGQQPQSPRGNSLKIA